MRFKEMRTELPTSQCSHQLQSTSYHRLGHSHISEGGGTPSPGDRVGVRAGGKAVPRVDGKVQVCREVSNLLKMTQQLCGRPTMGT